VTDVMPSVASLHEAAGGIGALPARIAPLSRSLPVVGRAFPVQCWGGDNMVLHHALVQASPGDVLVVAIAGDREYGHWGAVMSNAAVARGLAGLVIDGCVRDADDTIALGFPVFSTGLCIRGTGKRQHGVPAGDAVKIGDVIVHSGDLVAGDTDGVVVIPADQSDAVIEAARDREAKERRIIAALREGRTTLELLGLDG
jgi:4-hydroxy-4-methyl-2-oxoglutarate aldolase